MTRSIVDGEVSRLTNPERHARPNLTMPPDEPPSRKGRSGQSRLTSTIVSSFPAVLPDPSEATDGVPCADEADLADGPVGAAGDSLVVPRSGSSWSNGADIS